MLGIRADRARTFDFDPARDKRRFTISIARWLKIAQTFFIQVGADIDERNFRICRNGGPEIFVR